MSYVKITAGSYRNVAVDNEIFPIVKQFTVGVGGGFITVDGTSKFGATAAKIRIKVASPLSLEFVDEAAYLATGATVLSEKVAVNTVSDEQRISEIGERFEILDDMTKATLNGDIRAMIVSGPPGVGKSFTVERELDRAAMFDQISGRRVKSTIIKGSASPIGLYKALYDYSDSNCVIVFDDCDSILFDDVSLNLLKGALDSGKKRKISWLSESRVLKNEGIPNSFTFNGSVIFITNMKFDQVRSTKLKDHLEALQSRCHYLDLTLDTMRDKLLRIKQIAATGALFADYAFEQLVQDEIIDFMDVNKNKLREMSLRMAIKIAELRKSFPLKWESLAKTTCMKAN
jgi:hypothetical protein